eukprot:CAMPEP_0194048730 /NCGR_PEP_ID=MMETSP0009_2-20130614/28292_1 /TAXON_ID=210454 /ORGANISM="Grammatophora oceanica, Strain CCMP 410" /LENGTH=782 /DNA_ID=CAMNT_0038694683 /DNA_START=216 /DNA_END=2565 /DNA_ORIENTATION=-
MQDSSHDTCISAPAFDSNLPALLVQAARSAAEADGLVTPQPAPVSSHAGAPSASSVLASLQRSNEKKQSKNGTALAAMERARMAIAATQAQSAKPPSAYANMAPMKRSGGMSGGKKKGPPLRRGKWTPEEEAYANRLIQEFKQGLLPLTDGTTLRTFLSKLLNCDPMRISKKFVGSNCIGKQVFRRRTADINRLAPEQIAQSRAELSELERRFLERVAQTNRVKSSGVGGGSAAADSSSDKASMLGGLADAAAHASPPSPPWLQPPASYKQGTGAAMAAAALSNNRNASAAAAGRALLGGLSSGDLKSMLERKAGGGSLTSNGSDGLLAMAALNRANSRNSLLQSLSSQNSLLAAAAAANGGGGGGGGGGSNNTLSGSAMAQIARNASAARLAGLTAAGSMSNLLKGLSRDQLSQLARDGGTSAASLGGMVDRQSSFDALMSLDLQSLQSIDNLANLIQSGGSTGNVPSSGLKNADFGLSRRDSSASNLVAALARAGSSGTNLAGLRGSSGNLGGMKGSSGNLAGDLSSARRLASLGRMESLLRSLSSQNVNKTGGSGSGSGGGSSNANFSNLLASMQNSSSNNNNSGGGGGGGGGNNNSASANSLFGNNNNSASALSLANLLRADSSTGLTNLRMQDGLSQRISSVDDFLSLVASGDIPHQDQSLLSVPLLQQQQAQAGRSASAAALQQLLAAQQQRDGSGGSSSALANALARSGSFSSAFASGGNNNGGGGHRDGGDNNNSSAAALAQQALAGLGGSSSALKRKLMEMENFNKEQGSRKR